MDAVTAREAIERGPGWTGDRGGIYSARRLEPGESMGFIGMIVLGLVAGAVAKAIMPGKDPGGIVVTILLGIGGSVVGGVLAGMLGLEGGRGLVGSVIGALILLWAYRKLKKA